MISQRASSPTPSVQSTSSVESAQSTSPSTSPTGSFKSRSVRVVKTSDALSLCKGNVPNLSLAARSLSSSTLLHNVNSPVSGSTKDKMTGLMKELLSMVQSSLSQTNLSAEDMSALKDITPKTIENSVLKYTNSRMAGGYSERLVLQSLEAHVKDIKESALDGSSSASSRIELSLRLMNGDMIGEDIETMEQPEPEPTPLKERVVTEKRAEKEEGKKESTGGKKKKRKINIVVTQNNNNNGAGQAAAPQTQSAPSTPEPSPPPSRPATPEPEPKQKTESTATEPKKTTSTNTQEPVQTPKEEAATQTPEPVKTKPPKEEAATQTPEPVKTEPPKKEISTLKMNISAKPEVVEKPIEKPVEEPVQTPARIIPYMARNITPASGVVRTSVILSMQKATLPEPKPIVTSSKSLYVKENSDGNTRFIDVSTPDVVPASGVIRTPVVTAMKKATQERFVSTKKLLVRNLDGVPRYMEIEKPLPEPAKKRIVAEPIVQLATSEDISTPQETATVKTPSTTQSTPTPLPTPTKMSYNTARASEVASTPSVLLPKNGGFYSQNYRTNTYYGGTARPDVAKETKANPTFTNPIENYREGTPADGVVRGPRLTPSPRPQHFNRTEDSDSDS